MNNTLRTILLLLIFSGFTFICTANAFRFTESDWPAQHYKRSGPTGEYFSVIDSPGFARAKLKGFVLKSSALERNFSQLTGSPVNKGVAWFKIDPDRSSFINDDEPAPVPEPATMLLLGCGLIGIATAGRKKLLKK